MFIILDSSQIALCAFPGALHCARSMPVVDPPLLSAAGAAAPMAHIAHGQLALKNLNSFLQKEKGLKALERTKER